VPVLAFQICAVPVWIRLLEFQPSMPIQVNELLFTEARFAVGTVQEAEMLV
jgi:hypothetical protein